MRPLLILFSVGIFFNAAAQTAPGPLYKVGHIALPAEMDNQVCISGLNYFKGKLLFASERCPFVFSGNPATGAINNKLNTGINTEFEVEGITTYHDKIYLVSESQVAIYELDARTGGAILVPTSIPLPSKSKAGDGMEGIAANEKNKRFYLLRERNDNMTKAEIYSFSVVGTADNRIRLEFENKIELPLENPQWRYSDICYDAQNNRLLCLKSYSKGKLRQQFIEVIDINEKGDLLTASLKDLAVENFSSISNAYKDQDFSMNLEGITLDEAGNIYVVSDNTSGKARCDHPAKERTILLKITKN